MQILDIIFLSIIQGVSEFLPISSSGHLALYSFIFGRIDQGLIMDIILHLGTLLAVLIYFRADILGFIRALFAPKKMKQEFSLMMKLGVATIPVAVIGVLFNSYVEDAIRSPLIIAGNLMVFGLILWWAFAKGKKTADLSKLNYKQALLIGCAQVLAIIPGVSRSGITMSAAFLCGIKTTEAAKFSMLLSIPTISGAAAMAILKLVRGEALLAYPTTYLALGLALSAVFGIFAITTLMKWMGKTSYKVFAIYRLILGATIILMYFI